MHKQLGVSSGAMTLEYTPLPREAEAANLESNQKKVRKKRGPIPLLHDSSRCLCASLKPGPPVMCNSIRKGKSGT